MKKIPLTLLTITGLFLCGHSAAFAAAPHTVSLTQVRIVGTGANDASVGDIAITFPTRVNSDDNSFTGDVTGDQIQDAETHQRLKATMTGNLFTIPATATIVKIKIEYEMIDRRNKDEGLDLEVKILKAGVVSGNDQSKAGTVPGTVTIRVYDPGDTWGVLLTPADVNDADFGSTYRGKVVGASGRYQLSIDFIRITVTYDILNPSVRYETRTTNTATNGVDWINPGNATTSNDVRAESPAGFAEDNDTLFCTAFNHYIRSDATIDSVLVFVEGFSESVAADDRRLRLQLTKNNTAGVGDKVTITMPEGIGSEAVVIGRGSTNPLWNTTFTVAEVNASTFGVWIDQPVVTLSVDRINVDHVTIEVWFTGAGNTAGFTEFRTVRDSSIQWIRDGDPREGATTQARGNTTTMTMGTNSGATDDRHLIINDTVVYTGTLRAGNGIPTGQTIQACTLWIKLGALPGSNIAETVHDFYEVTEEWNETETNVVSWANRKAGPTTWTTAGVTGTKRQDSAIGFQRISATEFIWRLYDVGAGALALWDTFVVADADSLPIPLSLTTAQCIYAGTCHGLVMKFRTGPATTIQIYSFTASEGSVANTPIFRWLYNVPATGINFRRRRM